MKLEIFTLALDAMPFITWHLPVFNNLGLVDWHWTIVEGAASNVNCTKWCQPQAPRLSRDGTTEFVNSLRGHPCITVIQKQNWRGKLEMCNAAIQHIKGECVLMQIDADEIWDAKTLRSIVELYECNPSIAAMQFFCFYYLGWNIVTLGRESYGNRRGEWVRSWRFFPGNKWKSHEPPVFEGLPILHLPREETQAMGLMFHHYAYCTPQQVSYKEMFYGYPHALENWMRLQQNKQWPVTDLRKFLPWVGEGAQADLLHK